MFGIAMLLPGWLSWLLSARVFTAKHSQWTNGDSQVSATQRLVGGVESRRTNDTNETNWNGESGRFVHIKESFVQTDSFVNEPSLSEGCVGTQATP